MAMPFSRITDAVDMARAQAAFDIAWGKVGPAVSKADLDEARTQLALIVASLVHVAIDEEELAQRTVDRFNKKPAESRSDRKALRHNRTAK
ncbi:hypothetical protein [Bosea sp. ASV33]|uniref:hypothetical protein n=1 Tax=Bosea sp. ASV33 TaxID=2795106 RepID=UPI0018EB93BE|nr:hypothetical protein [Bosea sp. ASV33]